MHKFYSYLQAVATAEKEVKVTVDTTLPDAALLAAGEPQQAAFREAFGLSDAPVASSSGAKRQKVEKVETPGCLADWVGLWQQGNLSSQTIPTLKAFCKEQGLPLAGKKDDLMARIHDHLVERTKEDQAMAGGPSDGPKLEKD
jgi:hypothetical protein